MWQSIFAHSILWFLPFIGLYFVYRGISSHTTKNGFDNSKIYLGIVFTMLMGAFGIGLHAVSEIIYHTLLSDKTSFEMSFLHFIDETLSHFFMIPFTFIGYYLFVLLELSKKTIIASQKSQYINNTIGVIVGIFTGIGSIEGGYMHVITVPILILLYVLIHKRIKKDSINVKNYEFTSFYRVAIIFNVITVILYCAVFGLFMQPSDLLGF